MLKVKHLTFLSRKIEKKAGIFTKVARKIELTIYDGLCCLSWQDVLPIPRVAFMEVSVTEQAILTVRGMVNRLVLAAVYCLYLDCI